MLQIVFYIELCNMLNLCQIFSYFKLIQNSTGSSPTLVTAATKTMAAVPNHTPMSERQQLALIKKLEKEAAEEAAAAASPASSHNSTSSSNPKMSSKTGQGRKHFF